MTILGKAFGFKVTEELPSGILPAAGIDFDRLKRLIEFFPIGKKLRYFPEFKLEIVFDTIIVAYCVNGNFIYSGDAIDRDSQGYPILFQGEGNSTATSIAELKLFQVLVPDTSDLEMKLDYQRRALIGRGRQFIKGNYISLISNAGVRGISTVDTEVAKHVLLQEGPYAHTNMILLTPDLSTLTVTDQRQKSRTQTNVPVMMSLPNEKISWPCTVVDISEGEVRVRVSQHGATMPEMQSGDGVIMDIDLGKAERHYTIRGSVFRRSPETCVIHLVGQLKDEGFRGFTLLDLLELKAALLNYG